MLWVSIMNVEESYDRIGSSRTFYSNTGRRQGAIVAHVT